MLAAVLAQKAWNDDESSALCADDCWARRCRCRLQAWAPNGGDCWAVVVGLNGDAFYGDGKSEEAV